MTPQEARELLPAYALGALTPEERRAVEEYLETSEEARRELAEMLETTAALGAGFAQVGPPRALRQRVLAQVRPGATGRPSALWRAAVAAAAALVVLLGGLSYTLGQRLAALEQRLAQQEQILAVLASPSARTTALEGPAQGNVRFVYDPARQQGALIVTDLQDPGAEFVYQLWLIAGQQADSGGVFRPVPGRPVVLPVAADFERYQIVAITVERGPHGVTRSENAPVLVGRI